MCVTVNAARARLGRWSRCRESTCQAPILSTPIVIRQLTAGITEVNRTASKVWRISAAVSVVLRSPRDRFRRLSCRHATGRVPARTTSALLCRCAQTRGRLQAQTDSMAHLCKWGHHNLAVDDGAVVLLLRSTCALSWAIHACQHLSISLAARRECCVARNGGGVRAYAHTPLAGTHTSPMAPFAV